MSRNDSTDEPYGLITPIKIRDDLVIRIAGIPLDLKPAEAERIKRIIMAHVTENNEEQP